MFESNKSFKEQFPNFKRGITPIDNVNSMMDTTLKDALI